ncbi:MAG: hypothetical protein Kow0029_22480 [Candidatus Rifleibacteriota bacterium]
MIGNKVKSGFSLFEMLVVVAIVGVLALAAVPVAEITYVKALETELQNNLDVIRTAIQAWKTDCRNSLISQTSTSAVNELDDSRLYPPGILDLMNPNPLGYDINWPDPIAGPYFSNFKPLPYLQKIPSDPFVGSPRWKVYFASGTSTVIFNSSPIVPPPNHVGVFDISVDPDPTVRKGFVTAIDGTNYSDW